MTFSGEDAREIEALVVEHAWVLDHGQALSLADLYTDNGRLTGAGFNIVGREQMVASLKARPQSTTRRTHHQCTNIRITPEGANTARGWVSLVLRVRLGEESITEDFVGEYQDHYVRDTQGRWRFTERKLIPLGTNDEYENI